MASQCAFLKMFVVPVVKNWNTFRNHQLECGDTVLRL